jgi:hypothetical protein
MKGSWLLAGIMFGSACRMIPPAPPVPVQGTLDDLRVLSGEWSGSYWSKVTGRHGTIRFSLPAHATTGLGEVEITFSPSLRLLRAASATGPEPRTRRFPAARCRFASVIATRYETHGSKSD